MSSPSASVIETGIPHVHACNGCGEHYLTYFREIDGHDNGYCVPTGCRFDEVTR